MTAALGPALALLAWVAGWPLGRRGRALMLALAALGLAAWAAVGGATPAGWARSVAGVGRLEYAAGGDAIPWLFLVALLGLAIALWELGGGGREAPTRRQALTPLLAHGVILAAAAVVTARTPLSLLAAWEALSGLTYGLFLGARPAERTRRTGYLMLGVSELGVVALYWGILGLRAHPSPLPSGASAVLGVLALAAFGSKAGLFPFQVWLPVAEPETRGPVAGLMSGLLGAVALAALLRVWAWLAPPPLLLGGVTAALGGASVAIGSLGALVEPDLRRVLAYSTVETLGLAFTALGVSSLLTGWGQPGAAAAARMAALLLVISHAGGKWVLFAASGYLEDLGLPRRLDALGGLLQRLPWTGTLALLAAFGLGGLPPLGGFVGEWLLLESLLMPLPASRQLHALLSLGGGAVALLAAVALTAYLRWYGIAFLGPPRGRAAQGLPHRADPGWPGAAALLLALVPVVAAGIGSPWLVPWLQHLMVPGPDLMAPLFTHPALSPGLVSVGARLGAGLPGTAGVVFTPDRTFSILSPWDLTWVALGLGLLVYGVVRWRAPGMAGAPRKVRPWAGGRPERTPAYAFTAEGLIHPLRLSLGGLLGVRRTPVPLPAAFPWRYRVRHGDRLARLLYRELFRTVGAPLRRIRALQSGDLAHYVAYVLGVLMVGVALALWVRPA